VFGGLYGQDFRRQNDLLGELGLEALSAEGFARLMVEGFEG